MDAANAGSQLDGDEIDGLHSGANIMTKQQVFIILPALAASYGLGEMELGTAKAATEIVKPVGVSFEITGEGAIDTFDGFVGARACPLVNAEKELTGDDVCNLAEDSAYSGCWRTSTDDDGRRMAITVTVPVEVVETPGRLE